MSLTTDQKATQSYKKDKGVADTNTNKRFFEEPLGGRVAVASKTWAEDSLIPTTAPTLGNLETSGVVKRFVDLVLAPVPGSPDSFFHAELKDAVPFNHGDGTYAYVIKNNSNVILPAGYNDVEVDNVSGVLRFYGGVPSDMPPKISFYKYVGALQDTVNRLQRRYVVYVKQDASGTGNGSSWVNAYTSLNTAISENLLKYKEGFSVYMAEGGYEVNTGMYISGTGADIEIVGGCDVTSNTLRITGRTTIIPATGYPTTGLDSLLFVCVNYKAFSLYNVNIEGFNTAHVYGFMYYQSIPKILFENCRFINITCSHGILESQNTTTTISTWTIRDCYFLNCTTPKTGSNNGAMIVQFKKECILNIERCIFKGIVSNLGVVSCQPGVATITDCEFLNNDVRVGILYTSGISASIKVFRSSFEENTTDFGLLVCMNNNGEKSMYAYGCRIYENNVRELFAVYTGTGLRTITVEFCSGYNPTAALLNNESSHVGSSVVIDNSVFIASDLYHSTFQRVADVIMNTVLLCSKVDTWIGTLDNVLEANPLFEDTNIGNLRLAVNSPARGFGVVQDEVRDIYSLNAIQSFDIDGRKRFDTPASPIDVGAYSLRTVSLGVVFHQFETGALEEGVIKVVTHNQGLSNYLIMARDPDNMNNVQTNILRPDPLNPTTAIEIEIFADIPAPGLIIQIIGL